MSKRGKKPVETDQKLKSAISVGQNMHLFGLGSGLKSSYVLIHIENSGEEIQTSLPGTTLLNSTVCNMAEFLCCQNIIYLNWIHIVGDDDQLGLLALHQRGDTVHTCT